MFFRKIITTTLIASFLFAPTVFCLSHSTIGSYQTFNIKEDNPQIEDIPKVEDYPEIEEEINKVEEKIEKLDEPEIKKDEDRGIYSSLIEKEITKPIKKKFIPLKN